MTWVLILGTMAAGASVWWLARARARRRATPPDDDMAWREGAGDDPELLD